MNGTDITDQFAGAVRGRAAGVPFVALPPAPSADRPGLVLLWHGFSPPRSEEARRLDALFTAWFMRRLTAAHGGRGVLTAL